MDLIVIPAKPLGRAKARLAGVLDAGVRKRLTLAMLADVCAAATATGAEVWVVGSDEETFALARRAGANVVEDPTPSAGLVPSLEAVIPPDASGVLVLSSDLPCVTPAEIRTVAEGDGVALASNAAGTGTNALWRSPAGVIPLAFGEGSRVAHERLARDAHVAFRLVNRPGLALDIDTPEDLEAASSADLGDATRALLAQLEPAPSKSKRRLA